MATAEVVQAIPMTIEIVEKQNTVEVLNSTPTITTQSLSQTVEVPNTQVEVITVGIQGAKGEDGIGGGSPEPAYRQYDINSEPTTYYKGWSDSNDTSAPTWKILRGIEVSHDTFQETLADGNEDFDNIWDNRLSLTYT